MYAALHRSVHVGEVVAHNYTAVSLAQRFAANAMQQRSALIVSQQSALNVRVHCVPLVRPCWSAKGAGSACVAKTTVVAIASPVDIFFVQGALCESMTDANVVGNAWSVQSGQNKTRTPILGSRLPAWSLLHRHPTSADDLH